MAQRAALVEGRRGGLQVFAGMQPRWPPPGARKAVREFSPRHETMSAELVVDGEPMRPLSVYLVSRGGCLSVCDWPARGLIVGDIVNTLKDG